jgi:hypothetical protein
MKPIDPRFFNSETKAPFDSCMTCGRDLLDGTTDYFIERMMRRVPKWDLVETMFEYAMCMNCAMDMRQKMSKQSMENVENYFKSKVESNLSSTHEANDMERCLLTNTNISDCSEFSYHAYCRGTEMHASMFPYAVSDLAMDEISDLLSAETVDELDDFKGKYFTGPPEIAELINPRRLIPL